MKDTITPYSLINAIGTYRPFGYEILDMQNGVVRKCQSAPVNYVEPFLTQTDGGNLRKDHEPKSIIFVSAPGATGKSMLSEYLAFNLNCPIFDLGKSAAVGNNSFVGTFAKALRPKDYGDFLSDLQDGKAIVVIDGLDEAILKTKTEAYDVFIDDVVSNCSKDATCVIMLGRTEAVDYTEFYVEERYPDIKTARLEIASFDMGQARRFIDLYTGGLKSVYRNAYINLRDYILGAIDGFFKDQQALKKGDKMNFLGYAPVLMAVAKTMIKPSSRSKHDDDDRDIQEVNYQKLLQSIQSSQSRNIELVVQIVDYLFNREWQKAHDLVIDGIVKQFGTDIDEATSRSLYDTDEQCERLLCYVLSEKYPRKVSSNADFCRLYEEKIASWLAESPFINGRSFQNMVFESYILARMILRNPSASLDRYFHKRYKDAYMLFYVLQHLIGTEVEGVINARYFGYVSDSIKTLDTPNSTCMVEVQGSDTGTDDDEAIFVKNDEKLHYSICLSYDQGRRLRLGRLLTDLKIDSPTIGVEITSMGTNMTPPLCIICDRIAVGADITITPPDLSHEDKDVLMDCRSLDVIYNESLPPKLAVHISSDRFQIYSDNEMAYPYSEYWCGSHRPKGELDDDMLDKYIKFRKIIISFRSHSKGKLGRCKGKIGSNRLIGSQSGPKILQALMDIGVIYEEDNYMLFIDEEKINKEFGVTFDMVKSMVITDKIISFLSKI